MGIGTTRTASSAKVKSINRSKVKIPTIKFPITHLLHIRKKQNMKIRKRKESVQISREEIVSSRCYPRHMKHTLSIQRQHRP
jgi:hypothetical protein